MYVIGGYGDFYWNRLKNFSFEFVYIDIGANQGSWGLVLCAKKIYCHEFEPSSETFKSLKNYYITIPDFSGDIFYTFDASDYGNGQSYKQLKLRDPDGNKPVLPVNRNYTFNVYYSKDSFTYLKLNIV